ncbi:MAG: hypothetical protein J5I98_33035, partial [Phaeodactylibacter sp.]|nr:hypothetical protein [Phaeodactylibacter sp.]
QFFDEMRRLLKCIPEGMDKKGNEISSKKGRFLAQRVASKHTLNGRTTPAFPPRPRASAG